MQRTRLTRAELHALVWDKPLRTAAKELGVSDVGLSKICKRNGIPTPPQGHWTRVQLGRPVTRIELPPAASGQAAEIEFSAGMGQSLGDERTVLCPPGEETRRSHLIAREAEPQFQIVVAQNAKARHAMAVHVQKALLAMKPDDYGCVRCADPALPNVRVTPEGIPRAVALVDAIARAVDARGFRWKAGRDQRWDAAASIVIEDISFPIEIYEVVERKPHELTPDERARKAQGALYWMRAYDFFGSDRFSIRRGEWDQYVKDARNQKVEERLNELFSRLIDRAFEAREQQRLRAIDAEREARRAERRAEIKRLQTMENKALEDLHAFAENRRRAESIRSMVEAVRAAGAAADPIRTRWMGWAAAYADRIDPLKGDLGRMTSVDFAALDRLQVLRSESEDASD